MRRHNRLLHYAIAAILAAACAAPDATRSIATAAAVGLSFPKPYLVAGEWQETEFVPLPGAPSRVPTREAALVQVRHYFLAGIKTQVPDAGVTVVQIADEPKSRTIRVLVTTIGGANSAVAGRQEQVVLHHDERGWWMDPKGWDRVYCLKPLGGFAGTRCVD
jgi:hypothetical protein